MLNNKVALVTGAGRGIGREVALTLSSYGAKLVINYNESKEKAREVLEEIKRNGQEAMIYKADISSFDEVKEMVKYIKKEYGQLDILVNNAGITRDNL